MSYDLTIQPNDKHSTIRIQEVESFLSTLPGVHQESRFVFAYQLNRQRILIYAGDSAQVDWIGISVPASFSGASSNNALRLCFQIAKHFGWQVFDEQLGNCLDDAGTADFNDENEPGNSAGIFSFGVRLWEQLQNHDATPMIATVVAAAAIAGYFVVECGVAENKVAWLFLAAFALVHAIRALAVSIWQTFRHS